MVDQKFKVIRARPRFFSSICNEKNIASNDTNIEYFFNYGRSSLKFFLKCYNEFYNTRAKVLVQSFNCTVVSDAVLEAGCELYLCDVKLSDFSISLTTLSGLEVDIDILILTHYQGIPNQEYCDIIDFCNENNIFVIDDISQTEMSYINDVLVGSLSNISLHSFSFDKPFTSLFGGSFTINSIEDSFSAYIERKYFDLKLAPPPFENAHMKTLKLKLENSRYDGYQLSSNASEFIVFLFLLKVPKFMVLNLIKAKYLKRVFYMLYNRLKCNKIKILRMGELKRNAILKQREAYHFDDVNVKSIERLLSKFNVEKERYPNSIVSWNRYSLIDTDKKISSELINKGVEVGNFNWSITLDSYYDKDDFVLLEECFNTKFLSENILNIPVWINLEQVLDDK